ncbi:hypothetical protein OMA37_000515 [Vibrio fluvialis]|nr:hypothetical protein [Vibrio fluvialis]
MTRFEKTEKTITMLAAIWGCVLSSYLFVQNWENAKPTLYSSYTLLPESEDPVEGKTKRVRMDISVSNTGNSSIEIPPFISVTIFDTVSREERVVRANLLNIDGSELVHIIPTTLKQGNERIYRTTYDDINKFLGPYTATVVQMWSGDDLFIAPTEPSRNPKLVTETLNNEDVKKYFGSAKSYPTKFVKTDF